MDIIELSIPSIAILIGSEPHSKGVDPRLRGQTIDALLSARSARALYEMVGLVGREGKVSSSWLFSCRWETIADEPHTSNPGFIHKTARTPLEIPKLV